jgi:hypothetical protein
MSSSSSALINNNKLTDRLYKKETNNVNNINNNNDNIKRNALGLKPRMMASASAPVLRNLPSTQQLDDNKALKSLDKSKVATGTGVISTSSSAQLLLNSSSNKNLMTMTIGSRPGITSIIIIIVVVTHHY